jgi:hypothetical protein
MARPVLGNEHMVDGPNTYTEDSSPFCDPIVLNEMMS